MTANCKTDGWRRGRASAREGVEYSQQLLFFEHVQRARLFCTVSETFILHPVRKALLLSPGEDTDLGKTSGLNFRAGKLNFALSTCPAFCLSSLSRSLNPSSSIKLLSTFQLL